MTNKNWKKVKKYKGSSDIYSWRNKEGIRLVISEIQEGYDVSLSKLSTDYFKHLKSFRAKMQALKFAKSYMKEW